jgi:hypothetical protein
MRKLLFALLLIGVAISSATAQFFVVPDGALAPDGGLTYATSGPTQFGPGAHPFQGALPSAGAPYAMGPYPVYYPELWIPALMTPQPSDHAQTRQ